MKVNEASRRCCGIDIHKDTIVICVLPAIGCGGQAVRKTYGTFRNDLIRMRVWLKQLKVTEIAMARNNTSCIFIIRSISELVYVRPDPNSQPHAPTPLL